MVKERSLFDEEDQARSLLDQLLEDSRLYRYTEDYQKLLEFVAKLRNFAPFNAMLLEIQKPGLSYAASAAEWKAEFGRTIKEGARPLLILWPFSPVRLVYDVLDTDGETLPEDAACFPAHGPMEKGGLLVFEGHLRKKNIEWCEIDGGDGKAGSIQVLKAATKDSPALYRFTINHNHEPPTQFVTLAHELGHLFLGHLGADKMLRIPARTGLEHAQRELEAESVAYLIATRCGITAKSQTYLSPLLENNQEMPPLDLYQVMRAAGQVESLLDLKTPLTASGA